LTQSAITYIHILNFFTFNEWFDVTSTVPIQWQVTIYPQVG